MTKEFLLDYKTKSAEIVTAKKNKNKNKKKTKNQYFSQFAEYYYVFCRLIGVLRGCEREKRPGFLWAVI